MARPRPRCQSVATTMKNGNGGPSTLSGGRLPNSEQQSSQQMEWLDGDVTKQKQIAWNVPAADRRYNGNKSKSVAAPGLAGISHTWLPQTRRSTSKNNDAPLTSSSLSNRQVVPPRQWKRSQSLRDLKHVQRKKNYAEFASEGFALSTELLASTMEEDGYVSFAESAVPDKSERAPSCNYRFRLRRAQSCKRDVSMMVRPKGSFDSKKQVTNSPLSATSATSLTMQDGSESHGQEQQQQQHEVSPFGSPLDLPKPRPPPARAFGGETMQVVQTTPRTAAQTLVCLASTRSVSPPIGIASDAREWGAITTTTTTTTTTPVVQQGDGYVLATNAAPIVTNNDHNTTTTDATTLAFVGEFGTTMSPTVPRDPAFPGGIKTPVIDNGHTRMATLPRATSQATPKIDYNQRLGPCEITPKVENVSLKNPASAGTTSTQPTPKISNTSESVVDNLLLSKSEHVVKKPCSLRNFIEEKNAMQAPKRAPLKSILKNKLSAYEDDVSTMDGTSASLLYQGKRSQPLAPVSAIPPTSICIPPKVKKSHNVQFRLDETKTQDVLEFIPRQENERIVDDDQVWFSKVDLAFMEQTAKAIARFFAQFQADYVNAANKLLTQCTKSNASRLYNPTDPSLRTLLSNESVRGLESEIIPMLRSRQERSRQCVLQTQQQQQQQHKQQSNESAQRERMIALKYQRSSEYASVWARILAECDANI